MWAPRICFQAAPVWKGENSVAKESPVLIACSVILTGRTSESLCPVLVCRCDWK